MKFKIKPVYVFNIIAIIMIVVFVWFYNLFQNIQKSIVDTNYKDNILYVKEISNNLSNRIKSKIKSYDFASFLKVHKNIRKELENEMSLFVTNRYKYIYIVDKQDKQFRFLLDGSIDDKAMFLENYEPIEIEKWNSVYKNKKDLYFTHKQIKNLWITYLKPIIKNGKVVAILVIDFSIQPHVKIETALNKLDHVFRLFMHFFIFVFIIIVWFSLIDVKRENKLFKLNKTLEKRVKEEIEKNRQKDEQILYQSKLAQMGEMISMIAHQWRQPLSAISATIISIKFRIESKSVNREFLNEKMEILSNYIQHLSQTIDDFRNFFKPTKEKEYVSYEEIIQSVLLIIGFSIKNKNITLKTDIQYKKKIFVFKNQLKQVILNLIKNAEDVLEEKENKEINIRVYQNKDDIIFEIEDSGGGIDEKIKDRIFDPYFSTKDSKNGTGLGLYMSKIIVEKHLNGSLNVFNSKKGAVFQIILKEKNE